MIICSNVILSVKDDAQKHYVATAQTCHLQNDHLVLESGTTTAFSGKTWYTGSFAKTDISLTDFASTDIKTPSPKFSTMTDLNHKKNSDRSAFLEYHRRLANIAWLLFFPFLALWIMPLFTKGTSSLLSHIFASGSLFLFWYVVTSAAVALTNNLSIALTMLYGSSLVVLVSLFSYYKRKWL